MKVIEIFRNGENFLLKNKSSKSGYLRNRFGEIIRRSEPIGKKIKEIVLDDDEFLRFIGGTMIITNKNRVFYF